MSRLVNDLLSLARADAGYVMEKEWIPILPIVSETSRKAQFLERKVEWRVGSLDALEGMMVYGNADYLQQMLFIFIENAFKYTEEGYVSLKAVKENDQIGIQIADTGIGMDEEEVPHIFDRFYRADVSRGKTAGTGLGLAIAKWIIDEHGGSIEVMTQKGRERHLSSGCPQHYRLTNKHDIMDRNRRGRWKSIMEVIKISPRGYCYGVVDAMVMALEAARNMELPRPIYILGMIVHNRHVTEAFEKENIITLDGPNRLEIIEKVDKGTVIFTAHGVSRKFGNGRGKRD